MVGACGQLPAVDAATRGAPVFVYEYAQPSGQRIGDFPLGAYHGAEVRYFFDSGFPGARPPSFNPEEKAFADRLIRHWTTFARTGEPGPDWPAYRRGSATALSLAIAGSGPVELAREHRCGFWRSIR